MRRTIWILIAIALVLSVPFMYMIFHGNSPEALRYEQRQQLQKEYGENLAGYNIIGAHRIPDRIQLHSLGWPTYWNVLVYAREKGPRGKAWYIYLDNKNPVAWVNATQPGFIGHTIIQPGFIGHTIIIKEYIGRFGVLPKTR